MPSGPLFLLTIPMSQWQPTTTFSLTDVYCMMYCLCACPFLGSRHDCPGIDRESKTYSDSHEMLLTFVTFREAIEWEHGKALPMTGHQAVYVRKGDPIELLTQVSLATPL